MDEADNVLEEPGESLGRRIHGLHRYWRIYLDQHLAPLGLGSAQLPTLMALYHDEGLRQDQLARRLHVDKATITRALGQLSRQGYIHREKDPLDKRAYRLFLTLEGLELRPRVRSVLEDWTQILSMGLTLREVEHAHDVLGHMLNNAAALDAALKEAESGNRDVRR